MESKVIFKVFLQMTKLKKSGLENRKRAKLMSQYQLVCRMICIITNIFTLLQFSCYHDYKSTNKNFIKFPNICWNFRNHVKVRKNLCKFAKTFENINQGNVINIVHRYYLALINTDSINKFMSSYEKIQLTSPILYKCCVWSFFG